MTKLGLLYFCDRGPRGTSHSVGELKVARAELKSQLV